MHRRPHGRARQPRTMHSHLIPSSRPPSTAWKQVLLCRSFARRAGESNMAVAIYLAVLCRSSARSSKRCGIYAGHSVLVSAHTSAGKTVVAEYAFAMALR